MNNSLTTAPIRPRRIRVGRRQLLALTSLGLAGLVAGLLSGCSNAMKAADPAEPAGSYAALAGNWQFASGSDLVLAGSLSATGNSVTGRLHALAGGCADSSVSFPVTGTIAADNTVTLDAPEFSGGAVHIVGTLAADERSLLTPTLAVAGSGACARAVEARSVVARTQAPVSAVQYQAVVGNYSGNFTDSDGNNLAVSANLSQPTTPDANGVYHLTGSATFASAPCIGSPVITDSTVTGDQISATYTDSTSGATVTASGTFSSDAHTLTVTSWTLSGSCGSDNGTGILVHQ